MADTLELLRTARKKIEVSISKANDNIDRLKGRTDQASTRKRGMLNKLIDNLRFKKKSIEEKMRSANDSDDKLSDDVNELRSQLKDLDKSIEDRSGVISDQVDAISEKIDLLIEGNSLLEGLVSRERLDMKMKFNKEILKMIDNEDQKKEINALIDSTKDKFNKIDSALRDAIEDAEDEFSDDDEYNDAKDEASSTEKEIDSLELDRAELKQQIEDAPNETRKESLEKELADVESKLEKFTNDK